MLRQAVRVISRRQDVAHHLHQNATLITTPLCRPVLCQWLWETPTIRSFSVSASLYQGRSKQQRRKREVIYTPLPSFPPTSNPELDAFLEGMRQDQFILDHMPDKFRRIVLKSTRHHLLEEKPTEDDAEETVPHSIDIDGQMIDLKPIQARKYRSGTDLSKAMDLMKTYSDYSIVVQLVEAMSYSKIAISEDQWARCIRKLGLAGRPGLAKSIAWYAQDCRNSFPLTMVTARELFRSNLARHLMPGNSYVHMVYERLENLRKLADENFHLKDDPAIAGVELFITANIKIKFGAVDKAHNAPKYTRHFMQALERFKISSKFGFNEKHAYEYTNIYQRGTFKWYQKQLENVLKSTKYSSEQVKTKEAAEIARSAINDYHPLLRGLKFARYLLANPQNPEEAEAAQKMLSDLDIDTKINELDMVVKRWRKHVNTDGPVGLKVFEQAADALRTKYFLGEEGLAVEDKKAMRYEFIADREPIPGSWYASSMEVQVGVQTAATASS